MTESKQFIPPTLKRWMKFYRRRLSNDNALLPLSLLGIAVGLLAGVMIQAFRYAIEYPGDLMFGYHEFFEDLSPVMSFALPVYGAVSLGLFLQFALRYKPDIGLSHVIIRLNQHHGRLPFRAAILQFLIGIWILLTGQSSGREGPAIHLGAASGSIIGQFMHLPSNSLRILTSCGTAAAIAASFNTPIAGVIFAMEVIMLEYSLIGFIPVMLAASTGTAISHIVYGSAPAFNIPPLAEHSLLELPAYLALGIGIGISASLFCFVHQQALKLSAVPLWIRFSIAGLLTGTAGYFMPEILGMGYDTLDLALEIQIGLYALIGIGVTKLLVTAASSGLGLPVGIIGPSIVAGGCFGGAVGIVVNYLAPSVIANDSHYVMLGMGAMMGAVLNAPLAALIAVLELTNTPDIILPAMISIVIATLINSQIFKQETPLVSRLKKMGQRKFLSMFEVSLQNIGAYSLMNTNIQNANSTMTKQALSQLLLEKPRWLVLQQSGDVTLLNGLSLEEAMLDESIQNLPSQREVDLLGLPCEQLKPAVLPFGVSALEAWQAMQDQATNMVYIQGVFDAYAPEIAGVITRQDLENFYQQPRAF